MKIDSNTITSMLCLLILTGCSTTNDSMFEDISIVEQGLATVVRLTQEVSPSPFIEEAAKSATQPVPAATTTTQPNPTPVPTEIAPSAIPIPTLDVASSTLSKEATTQNLIELLETNRGCELPCWWGIVPG